MPTIYVDCSKSQRKPLEQEARLRGLVAAVSADMEGLLLRLILYCSIDDPDAALRNYSKLTLRDKIIFARRDLKTYYPERYKKHITHFNHLNKFNKFRGRLIHCDIVWNAKERNKFKVLDFRLIKGEWRVCPIEYTTDEVAKRCYDFGLIIKEFGLSTIDIIEVVAAKYPELIKSPNS